MGEKFAKCMITVFVVMEIGMFTQRGELGQVEIGPFLATESSLYLLIGLIYSSAIAVFLVFFNSLMAKTIRVIGYIGAILFVAAMAIYNHQILISRFLNLMAIISIPVYLIGIIIEGYFYNPKKEKRKEQR